MPMPSSRTEITASSVVRLSSTRLFHQRAYIDTRC